MRIIIYNWKDSVSYTPKELGLKKVNTYYFKGYDVINKKLFFLSVIKYGIVFREERYRF